MSILIKNQYTQFEIGKNSINTNMIQINSDVENLRTNPLTSDSPFINLQTRRSSINITNRHDRNLRTQ